MSKITWIDETSYQRGEERVPKTWFLNLDNIKIYITRHIHYGDTWVLRCDQLGIDILDLETNKLEEAKERGLITINMKLLSLIKTYSNISDMITKEMK